MNEQVADLEHLKESEIRDNPEITPEYLERIDAFIERAKDGYLLTSQDYLELGVSVNPDEVGLWNNSEMWEGSAY